MGENAIMTEPKEIPICSCEAIKASYRQTSKGIAVTFLLQPQDVHEKLAMMPLGEVCQIYVTQKDMGL